jgi:ABC-2 type transport system permease protein
MTTARKLRVIRRLFAVNLTMTMAYRFEFLIYMLGSIVTPVIGLVIWRATSAAGAELAVSDSYLTTYFVLSSLFALVSSSWHGFWIPELIRTGKLSVWLARPGSVWFEIIANNAAEKAMKAVFLIPLVVLFAWGYQDDLAIPTQVGRWALSLTCLVLGLVMFFATRSILGTIAFWTEETASLQRIVGMAEGVLLGGLIPLALFPAWSQGFLDVQLFRFRFAFALEVLLGDATGRDLAIGVILQVAWAVGLTWFSVWLWRRGRRSYIAVGG